MVTCGCCKQTINDAFGAERDASQISHCCGHCKLPVHAYINEAGCEPWMPEYNYYFCGLQCLCAWNTAVLAKARLEAEEEDFGPGHEAWHEWILEHPNKYFLLRRGPEGDIEPNPDDTEEAADMDDTVEEGGGADAIPETETTGETETPRSARSAVLELVQPGTRVQQLFAGGEEGVWYGGVVGDQHSDCSIPIGFDDGDLQAASMDELITLYEKERLCACTVLAGMVGGESQDAFAHSLCYMKCGEEQIAVGVLLKVNGVGPYELAGHPMHFAHVVCAESVEAAISSRQRDTRSKAQRDDPADLCGYHTYSHGDLLVDVEMPAVEETCFGVLLIPSHATGRGKVQQRRYLITWHSPLSSFSITPWNSWKRQPASDGVTFDAETSEGVKTASAGDRKAMCEAWDAYGYAALAQKANTLDKIQKLSKLGSAQVLAVKQLLHLLLR